MVTASVIINTRNEEQNIVACLNSVLGQRYPDAFEVIVVDSGSTDRTVEIAKTFPVKLLQTPPEEFSWGRNRNVGAEAATGRYLIYLSADALPNSDLWLLRLVQGFRTNNIAGVYGRQLPRDWAYPMEQFYLEYTYGPHRRIQKWDGGPLTMDQTWFSNVCSAIRRDVWERIRFSDTVLFGEDQEWSLRALRAGYHLVYEPDAAVIHAHNYTLGRAFKRWFNSGVSSYESYMPDQGGSPFFFARRGVQYLGAEMVYLATHGHVPWIPYALAYESAKFAGLILGRYHDRLPRTLTSKIVLKY